MELNSSDPLTLNTSVCEHNNSFVREARPRISGLMRRRWECKDCGHRWTVLGPDKKQGRKPKPRTGGRHPLLTLEQVKLALTDRTTSDVKLAAQMGVSRQAVNQIRAGKTWTHVFPELPRRPQWRDCQQCRHWEGDWCGMGFPDPVEEGTGFAGDCDLYEV